MLTVLDVTTYEIASTAVYGLGAFAILVLGLLFVRHTGKFRPHS
jgi:hypothetical protein